MDCPHCGSEGFTSEEVSDLRRYNEDEVADMIPCPCCYHTFKRIYEFADSSGILKWREDLDDPDQQRSAVNFLGGAYLGSLRKDGVRELNNEDAKQRALAFVLHIRRHQREGIDWTP